MTHSISLDLCLELFPMVMCLRESGEIRFVSEKLQHRMPNLRPEVHLHDAFKVKSPLPSSLHTTTLNDQHLKSLFLLIAADHSFALRGQLTKGMFEQEHVYIFIGSPWLSWLHDNLPNHETRNSEFPIYDIQMELQIYLVSQKMMMQDLEDLSAWLKQSKQLAETASIAKTQFVRHISHELRTPLNGVITALRLAQDEVEEAKKMQLLQIANSAGNTLMDLVNEVLDFSRLEEGVHIKESIEFSTRRFFKEIETGFSARAMKKGVQLIFEISPTVPTNIRGDRKSLQKILLNLIGNGLKYSRSDVIWVRANATLKEQTLFQLQVEVEDRGIGIAEENFESIFDPFWVDSNTYNTEPSTGLGLAITKQLVVALGGKIDVTSKKDQGTCFQFDLPVHALPETVMQDSTDRQLGNLQIRYQGRILLVEDNLINLELGKLLIEKHGFTVYTADSGEAAVECERDTEVDLIFMDINLPGIDGTEATKAIRDHGRNRLVPIIALTANVAYDDLQLYKASGMNDVMTKPIKTEEMHRICNLFFEPLVADETPDNPESGSPMGIDPVLDVNCLNAVINDLGAESFTEILNLFYTETDKRFSNLLRLIADADNLQVSKESHRLASSSLSFGLVRLGNKLRLIEKTAISGSNNPQQLITELQDLYHTSIKTLSECVTP